MGFVPSGSELGLAVSLLVALFLLIVVYPLPTYIAFRRQKRNAVAILALNVLVGWTFIGWVAAFIWALTRDHQR